MDIDIDRLQAMGREFDELLKIVFAMPEDDDDVDMRSQPDDGVDVMQVESGSEIKDQKVGSSHKHSRLEPVQENEQLELIKEQNPNMSSQNSGLHISQQIRTKFGDPDRMHQSENQHQYPKLRKMDNQHALVADTGNHNKPVSFTSLLPVIVPHLDKDRAIQLQALCYKLQKKEIDKAGFWKHLKDVVGDWIIGQAVHKIQTQSMHSEVNVEEAFAAALNRDFEGDTSISQHFQSDAGLLPQGRQSMSSQSLIQKQDSSQVVNDKLESKEADSEILRKRVSFASLLPVVIPHLDKDRTMLLQMRYSMLQKKEINKASFLRDLRSIVGDQMLRQAVHNIHKQASRS